MPERIFDGDNGFTLGVNSGVYPERLPVGGTFRAWNAVNRGRIWQCRPGFKTRFQLPSGNLQGFWEYRPLRSAPALVFVVDGKVYYSLEPFLGYSQLPNIQMDPYAKDVFLESCIQVVRRNADGSRTLIQPRAVLIIQDGLTKPAFFDGATSGHIPDSAFKLPLGTVMKWAGNRLWVARRNSLFASDIGNPFSFEEGQYVGTINSFVLPDRITAMAEVPSITRPFLAVFTEDTTTFVQSNLQQRALWVTTVDFIRTVFRNLGCPGHRSPVAHHGVLWWMSKTGMMRLDVAISGESSSAMPILDNEMAVSKSRVSSDLSTCAGATFENYMLQSVPYASFENQHTWVRDTSPGEEGWNGQWTGVRPVGWVTGSYSGSPRCFFVSRDYDGANRLWEAFEPERLDNGCRIKWGFETRGYSAQSSFFPKRFRYADLFLSELRGDVDISVGWASAARGPYQEILNKRIHANEGSLGDRDLEADEPEFAYKKQTRLVRTQDQLNVPTPDNSSCSVESDREDWVDPSFQLCVNVSGPGAVSMIRVYMEDENVEMDGKCESDEENIRAVRFDGAGASGDDSDEVHEDLSGEPGVFTSTQTVTVTLQGLSETATATETSLISQQAADKNAQCAARLKAQAILNAQLKPRIGGFAEGFPI